MIATTYRSPLGDIMLAADERGLTGLWFAGQRHFGSTLASDAVELPVALDEVAEQVEGCDAVSGGCPIEALDPRNAAAVGVLERAWAWLNAYFAGQDPRWTPPLHLEGTPFQHEVWVALLSIPRGHTATYGQIARQVAERLHPAEGVSVSPRAVGGAVGRNPISIIVPCHRVLGADGSLTGYAGGLDRKVALLELEGVDVAG